MPFEVGEMVGSYRLIAQLGQGGMATVYKAHHEALDRFVAIKVLHIALNEDPNFLARFKREARVVARLEHPNIVPIYDFAEDGGRPYLVMKFIEGETLKARLERGSVSSQEIIKIMEAVGSALAYAHRQGVLHRDVKPSNVLLATDGGIYLADFGLARMAQSGDSSLTADRLVGTPQYISPEQALSKADLDARTDVYSFGVMLYELLVGRVPFNADTPFAIIHDHIYTPLPMPRTVNPDIPEPVEQVLVNALAKDRDDRFADISSLVVAMRSVLEGSPLPTPISTGLPPTVQAEHKSVPPPPVRGSPPISGQPANPTNLPPSPDEILLTLPDLPQAGPQQGPVYPPVVQPGLRAAGHNLKPLWIGLGVLAFLVAAIVIFSAFRNSNQQKAAATTMASAMKGAPAADLNAAIEAWQKGDLAGASAKLNSAMRQSGDEAAFYKNAFDTLSENKAWLLLGMMAFSADSSRPLQNLLQQRERTLQIHQALYLSASDPLAGDFLKQNSERVLFFKVAPIRSELFFGDAAKARQQLIPILNSTEQSQLYPEAKLLEVEILQKTDPAQARQKLDNVLKEKNVPDWVHQFAVGLDPQIPK